MKEIMVDGETVLCVERYTIFFRTAENPIFSRTYNNLFIIFEMAQKIQYSVIVRTQKNWIFSCSKKNCITFYT